MAQTYNVQINRFNGTDHDTLLPKNSLNGTTDPTTSTKGFIGQFYMNTSTNPAKMWQCVGESGGVYSWKPKYDSFIAKGTTDGSASALTLEQLNFTLSDGVGARFKLHTIPAPSPNVTLNINSTGAKPVITSNGKPFKNAIAGSWVTVVYSLTLDSFILQGDGSDGESSSRFGNGVGQISTYQFITGAWKPSLSG